MYADPTTSGLCGELEARKAPTEKKVRSLKLSYRRWQRSMTTREKH